MRNNIFIFIQDAGGDRGAREMFLCPVKRDYGTDRDWVVVNPLRNVMVMIIVEEREMGGVANCA